jgi:hypothetical protein
VKDLKIKLSFSHRSLSPSLYLTLGFNPHCLEKLCPSQKERHLSKDSFLLAMSKLF